MNHEDTVVQSSRREALAALGVWLLAMSYTVGYCYLYGFRREPAAIRLIYGVPDWVLWGVVAPWTTCTVIAGLFAWLMPDADLGEDPPDADDDLLGPREPDDE